jgi:hypothetical protein
VRLEPVLMSGPDELRTRSQRWPKPKVGLSVGQPANSREGLVSLSQLAGTLRARPILSGLKP